MVSIASATQNREVVLSDESNSSFEAAKSLTTQKVKQAADVKKLQKLVSSWADIAAERHAKVDSDRSIKSAVWSLSYSVHNLSKVIRDKLKGDTSQLTLYQVKDQGGKVQGVAIAKISSESEKNEILCLATHPLNVAIFPGEQSVKGVGRKLLTEVVKDVFFKNCNNNRLHLQSQMTARKFYEKFGFVLNRKEKIDREKLLVPMLIAYKEMGDLLEKSGLEVEIEINLPTSDDKKWRDQPGKLRRE